MGGGPSMRLREHLPSRLLGAGSSLQLQYSGSWTFILETNMLIEKGPNLSSNCRNVPQLSFQLLEAVLCQDSQSACSFSALGRCSAWMVVFFLYTMSRHLLLGLRVEVNGYTPHPVQECNLCDIVQTKEDRDLSSLGGELLHI